MLFHTQSFGIFVLHQTHTIHHNSESCLWSLQSALKSIISRDSFCAPEVHIFQGVYEWVERNAGLAPELTQEILSQIRLPLISLSDLLNVVRPTGLISPDQILDAIKAKNESRDMDLHYRGYLSEWQTSGWGWFCLCG
ncbi:BTB/POZ domain-containing protein 9 [Chionoecetes opilio]|uniref:BTB/POZ domain-containing protein 9 n=1 Tax=Chionoecetes opilio TaxID=41210 RepID=A0A8J5CMD8_CHIOP|nr:BTB/POZ domain-containing protein 9 [Chionoecetes opilio]